MEVLRGEKQLRFCPWVNRQQGGHEISVCGCSATRGAKKKCLRETKTAKSLCVRRIRQNRGESGIACMSEFNRGAVCVEAWTDSPATPLPKQLTAINSLSYQQKLLTEGDWNKTMGRIHMGIFPNWPKV